MTRKLVLGMLTLAATIGLAGSLAAMETMDVLGPFDDDTLGRMQSASSGPLASGRVVAVDRAAGKITLDYPPIPQLLLEGGIRNFAVEDTASLNTFAPGDKVRFEVERDGRSFVVKRIVNSN